MKLTDCHYEKRDWRKCTAEVRDPSLGIELGGFGGWSLLVKVGGGCIYSICS